MSSALKVSASSSSTKYPPFAPAGDGVHHPVGHLLERPLALRGAERAPEVLLGQDVGGVEAPPGRHLDAELLEGHRPGGVIDDPGVPPLPLHRVIGILSRRGELPTDADARPLGGHSHPAYLLKVVEYHYRLWSAARSGARNHKMRIKLHHRSSTGVNRLAREKVLVKDRSRRFAFWLRATAAEGHDPMAAGAGTVEASAGSANAGILCISSGKSPTFPQDAVPRTSAVQKISILGVYVGRLRGRVN